jgi:hypothetical protein
MRLLLFTAILALCCVGCAADHHNPTVGERWSAAYDPTNGAGDALWDGMFNAK